MTSATRRLVSLYDGVVWNRIPKGPHMNRLLGCLLVIGGCSAKTVEVDEPKTVAVQGSESVNAQDVKTVDVKDTVFRDGLRYEVNSEIPFTGILTVKYVNGKKKREETYKDGKLRTGWFRLRLTVSLEALPPKRKRKQLTRMESEMG